MFEALKKIFKKEDKKKEETPQVSDSKGQEGVEDVAEVENLEYESE